MYHHNWCSLYDIIIFSKDYQGQPIRKLIIWSLQDLSDYIQFLIHFKVLPNHGACAMYSSRKSSVKRHIQNIRAGNANFVSFVDYLVGRNMSLY